MRKSKVLSFVLVAALAVTAIPINAFGTVSDEKNKLSDLQNQKQQAQVGAFRNRQLAESLNLQLRRQGFPSRVVMEDNLFKVRVGDFRTLDNAVAMELKLRLLGYNTFVVS